MSSAVMGSSTTTIAVLFVGALMGQSGRGSYGVQRGRLLQNFRPIHYDVRLTPDIYKSAPPFPFTGRVFINLNCSQGSNAITINSQDLTIDGCTLKISLDIGQSGRASEPAISSWTLDATTQRLLIKTTEVLVPGVRYVLQINFNGTMRDDGNALYYDEYDTSDGKTKYIATTHLQPHYGRMIFPCFDEPDFKATFKTTIYRRPPAISVANSPLRHSNNKSDGWVVDVYENTPRMSFYLFAFAVGDLRKIPAGVVNGYQINLWARPEIVPLLNLSRTSIPLIHAWLDNETGIKYAQPKSDHLILPYKNGAMENWGLVSYNEAEAIYDPKRSTAEGKRIVASFQSHEVVHMWYGNLVTCKWWDDLWLNEGFATYYDYRPTQALGWEGSEASQVDTQTIMEMDQRNTSHPVRRTIKTPSNASDAFNHITYLKGGAIVRMLEGILTTPTFKAGLKKYLQKYKYNSATTKDLWRILTDQAAVDGIKHPNGSPLNVSQRMDPWLNQMGFPLVSVTRKANGTATFVRSHFRRPANQFMVTRSLYNYTWDVPITYASADSEAGAWDAAPSVWIDIGVTSLSVTGFPTDPKKWAVINPKGSMYYRVVYDTVISLPVIVAQLLQDHTAIHVESRSQIIDDAFSVARSGHIFGEQYAMETTRYLAKETRWGPWNAALKHFAYSDRLIRNLSWGELQRTYVLGLTVPVYKKLGWNYRETETPFQQFLRRDMISVSCTYGYAECLTEARKQYALIVSNPASNVVDPNNLPTVLCVGVREGTEADWQLTFNQYLARRSSQIHEERYAYLFGCTCTNDTTLLVRLLLAYGTSVESRDRNQLAHYLSLSEVGAELLWNYLDLNWDSLTEDEDRMKILKDIGLGFSTEAELDKLKAFRERHPPTIPAETNAYRNLVLDIEYHIEWLPSHGVFLEEWLKNHQPAEDPSTKVRRETSTGSVRSTGPWQPVHRSHWSELRRYI